MSLYLHIFSLFKWPCCEQCGEPVSGVLILTLLSLPKTGGWGGMQEKYAQTVSYRKAFVTGITVVSRATGRPSSTAQSSPRCELLLSVGSAKWVARSLLWNSWTARFSFAETHFLQNAVCQQHHQPTYVVKQCNQKCESVAVSQPVCHDVLISSGA